MPKSAGPNGRAGKEPLFESAIALFDSYFFFPDREVCQTPADKGIDFEDIYFSSEDGVKLNGWYVKGRTDVTWVWFHGNAGNIGSRVEDLSLYHHHFGANIFLFDYRGYGRSAGKPTEKGIYRDATGTIRYLLSRQDLATNQVLYFGQSLGGAVAVELASRHPPAGLILESTFSSASDMARVLMPGLPVHLLVRSKFNSVARIRRVSCPVLAVHGAQDDVVPPSQGRKLYDAAAGQKRWLEIPGADHTNVLIVGGDAYLRTLEDFLSSLKLIPS